MPVDSSRTRRLADQEATRQRCAQRWQFSPVLCFLVLLFCIASPCRADVIVLANRTSGTIEAEFKPVAGTAERVKLASGDVQPLFLDGQAHVRFNSGGETKRHLLHANAAYYFGLTRDGRLGLQEIGLGDDKSTAAGRSLPGRAATAPVATIPVKIFVDEEEPARQQHWERRLRQRVEAASAVLDRHCRVRLKVVAVGTWDTDDATSDFFTSLSEFEREVKPFPAQLAIGFTSQYQVMQGRTHLAGTRGSLHTHILVREWSQHMSEPERLELLVHELGHFLGASHSPESDSVMRPVLGNRNAVRQGFRVRFDPVNTLIIAMVGEELRRRKVQQLTDMSQGTKLRLRQIYQALSPTLPDDPAAQQFVQRMDMAATQPLVLGTRQVVAQILRSAHANVRLPAAEDAASGGKSRLTGDALTEYYAREAAGIARFLPEDIGPQSFLLGLGIALDDTNTLRNHPKYGNFVKLVDTERERAVRLASLGEPTLMGRHDLALHYFVSAHLATIGGTRAAAASGLAKELSDAKGKSGFSFADLAANRAGILFAGGLLNRRWSLENIAKGFTVGAYMPSVEDLPESLTVAQLMSQFGGQSDDRFRKQLQTIDQRLLALPPYRRTDIALER